MKKSIIIVIAMLVAGGAAYLAYRVYWNYKYPDLRSYREIGEPDFDNYFELTSFEFDGAKYREGDTVRIPLAEEKGKSSIPFRGTVQVDEQILESPDQICVAIVWKYRHGNNVDKKDSQQARFTSCVTCRRDGGSYTFDGTIDLTTNASQLEHLKKTRYGPWVRILNGDVKGTIIANFDAEYVTN